MPARRPPTACIRIRHFVRARFDAVPREKRQAPVATDSSPNPRLLPPGLPNSSFTIQAFAFSWIIYGSGTSSGFSRRPRTRARSPIRSPPEEHLIIVTELLRDNLYEFSKFNREQGQEPYFTLGHLQRVASPNFTSLVLCRFPVSPMLWQHLSGVSPGKRGSARFSGEHPQESHRTT